MNALHDPLPVKLVRWTASAVTILLLAVTCYPSAPWILCLGDDGHRALERSLSPELPCTIAFPSTDTSDECGPEACSGCTDIDLSSKYSLRQNGGSWERADASAMCFTLAYEPNVRPCVSRARPDTNITTSGTPLLSEIILPTVLIRC